ncbi:MAG: hypothetical protein Kow006_02380 [Gammaproteobacteria bacterium]
MAPTTPTGKLPAALMLAVLATPSAALALNQPDCNALEKWSAGHASTGTVALTPNVEISSLFADERTEPLFGTPVGSWNRNDFNQVSKWLKTCRRAASKRRDKTASDNLYQAMKIIGRSARSIRQIEQHRQAAHRAVDNLLNSHRSNDLVMALKLAQRALGGEDIRSETDNLSHGIRNALTALQNAYGNLPAGEVESLRSRLGESSGAAEEAMTAQNEEFEALERELAEVPLTEEGARRLDAFNKHPVLQQVSRDEAQAFYNAVAQKRSLIAGAVARQRAEQAAKIAATPVALSARLNSLIQSDSVEDVSLQGLRPGLRYSDAQQILKSRFNYKAGAGVALFKTYAPTRRDLENYRQMERRDGGLVELDTMGQTVGLVRFMEHYTGPVDLNEPRDYLAERFGKPDQSRFLGNALWMKWSDDGINLEVKPGMGSATPSRSRHVYKSSLVITLWSDEFKEHLEEAKARCKALQRKSPRDLSAEEKMDLLQGCRS